MTEKEFYKKFKGVNCPTCRGAKMPKFDPAKINEEKFSDELRFKSYESKFIKGDEYTNDIISIEWESQGWDNNGINSLVEEIRRCFKHIGFVGNVELTAWERGEKGSEEYEAYREFDVI